MTIAGSIFLMAVGAILYFALNLHIAEIDLDVVGIILMIAGGVGLIFGLIQQAMWTRRSRPVAEDERPPPPTSRY